MAEKEHEKPVHGILQMPPDGSFPFSLPTTAVGTTTLAPVRPSSGPPNAGVVVGPLKQMSGMSVRSETSFIKIQL